MVKFHPPLFSNQMTDITQRRELKAAQAGEYKTPCSGNCFKRGFLPLPSA